MPIDALRTPEVRLEGLPDFAWTPRYLSDLPGYEGLRAAYLDEGPRDARHTFLCLHGEPTWGFLYRRMIPPFLTSGARVVVPDFFGFGRSDKPVDDAAYTFHFHRNFLLRFLERLDLQRITLVVQDWGGLLALTLPIDPQARTRIARLLVMNTGLAVGDSPGPGFESWRGYVKANPDFAVGKLLARGCPHLTPAEVAAYDAPFPDVRFKAGVRAFPPMVMTSPDQPGVAESKAARDFWRDTFDGPVFMAYGAKDPVFSPAVMEAFRGQFRGCGPAMVVPDGGHFVQEWGAPIAEAALKHFGDV